MITIYSPEEIEKIKISGHINYLTHKHLEGLIKPGVSTKYLNEEADKFIREKGATPTFLGYKNFPASICISIDDEVTHGIPSDRILEDGQIVSIDIGITKDGYISDSANTYPVGEINAEKERLLHHTKKMLQIGLDQVKDGAHIKNIGAKIQEYANKYKYGIVRELQGHGVGKNLHEAPDIPNYGNYGTGARLKTGMVIAIEPMINAGTRKVFLLEDDNWTIVTQDGKPSAIFEHTVVVTDSGYEILTGE